MRLGIYKDADEIRAMYARLQKKGFGFDELLKAWSEYYDADDIQRVVEAEQDDLPLRKSKKAKSRAEPKPATTKANKVREWRSRWRALPPTDLPPVTRLVLWEVSDHMDWDTGDNAYPSMQTIATGTGLSEKSVRLHRNLAVTLGWLRTYDRMKKHGLGLAYRISFPSDQQKSRAPELVRKALTPKRKPRKAMP